MLSRHWARSHREGIELGLATAALAVGVAVYLLDRGGRVEFVPIALTHSLVTHRVFGGLAGSLPSFVHVFAFALLTAAVLKPWPRFASLSCLAWVLIDVLFELGQLHTVAAVLAAHLPGPGGHPWLLAQLRSYFVSGTFDTLDLAAAVAGGMAAYCVIVALGREADRA